VDIVGLAAAVAAAAAVVVAVVVVVVPAVGLENSIYYRAVEYAKDSHIAAAVAVVVLHRYTQDGHRLVVEDETLKPRGVVRSHDAL